MHGPNVTDAELFAALDLEYPGLEGVKAAVVTDDLALAKQRFVEHIKRRESPRWHLDWRGRDRGPNAEEVDLDLAERYARNDLVSVGVWHDFGDEIDWRINPMPNQYAEWTWQLSRHSFWAQLGQAYWQTGDERYARAFVVQLNSWVDPEPSA